MSDTVSIRYGKGELHIRLPNGCEPTIIRKPEMPVIEDARGAIRNALSNPINSPSIEGLVQGIGRVCLVICDITRPVPNGPILRELIDQLHAHGVGLDRSALKTGFAVSKTHFIPGTSSIN